MMLSSEYFVVTEKESSPAYGSLGQFNHVYNVGNRRNRSPQESKSDMDVYEDQSVNDSDNSEHENERTLLLPSGANIESNADEDLDDQEAQIKYRHQNRFVILFLVALTPVGVKFFKAAQSSFEEYLMRDPHILMSATTYSLMLSLMSFPIATLLGGAMLDYKGKEQKEKTGTQQRKNRILNCCMNSISSRQSCLGTSRTPSYSAVLFLGISLFGMVVYGYGLETVNSIPIGLIGATIFGLGEGCVVVASRTFAAHAFYGSDGAFAQGVLVAMNNLAMMASKISLPWLIENRKKITNDCIHNISLECLDDDNFAFDHSMTISQLKESSVTDPEANANNIWIGVVACCFVQLVSLAAGILYAWWFGLATPPHSLQASPPQEPGQSSQEGINKGRRVDLFSGSSLYSRMTNCFENLPTTFWIVAIGRGIFVVVFKVFTRNSNSFLMEKFGASAITAGRKSSFHELFALGSPVVGLAAYRSPGGIVPVLLFASALASISIALLACLPAKDIQDYLPGGAVGPMIGISIAHGIFIPVCMAIIPQTCAPEQLGMAFAVVEVLGSVFNLTNILFGWLRDATGSYEAPMEMLLLYTLVGMFLLWTSRNHIKLKQPNDD